MPFHLLKCVFFALFSVVNALKGLDFTTGEGFSHLSRKKQTNKPPGGALVLPSEATVFRKAVIKGIASFKKGTPCGGWLLLGYSPTW